MGNTQKTNIAKEILIEKTNFISNNSFFFYSNLNNTDLLLNLKEILLNPTPLTQCTGYAEVVEEIKKTKKRCGKENSYQYSLETLFRIVYLIRSSLYHTETIKQQTEMIRQYVKYVSTHDNGHMYYNSQNTISINMNQANNILEQIKKEKAEKVAQKRRFK